MVRTVMKAMTMFGGTTGYLFGLVGFGVAIYHVVKAVMEERLRRSGFRVAGVVIDSRQETEDRFRLIYYPIVRFTGVDGVTHVAETARPAPAR